MLRPFCQDNVSGTRQKSWHGVPSRRLRRELIHPPSPLLAFPAIGPVVFLLELFDTACTVDVLHRTGVKRMAGRADIDLQFLNGTSSLEGVATAAMDFCFEVFRVDVFLHDVT